MTTNEVYKILGIIEAITSPDESPEKSFHTAKPAPFAYLIPQMLLPLFLE